MARARNVTSLSNGKRPGLAAAHLNNPTSKGGQVIFKNPCMPLRGMMVAGIRPALMSIMKASNNGLTFWRLGQRGPYLFPCLSKYRNDTISP